ncbi:Major facilitator superfamily, partial [Globisporangium splendens]
MMRSVDAYARVALRTPTAETPAHQLVVDATSDSTASQGDDDDGDDERALESSEHKRKTTSPSARAADGNHKPSETAEALSYNGGSGDAGDDTTALCGMHFWICALSALSGFLFGYDLCVMVIALPLIQALVVSVLMVGAVFGSLVGGVGADWIGRKPAIIVTASFFLLGSLFMTFAGSYTAMLLGRFLAGLAVGSSGPCVSVYLSEIARPERRGVVVTINEVMLCVGCLVSVIISGLLLESKDGWRKMLGVTLLPPVVQLTFNHSMWNAIQLIATDSMTRKRVLLSMSIALGHNLTGANAMLYYSSYILGKLSAGGTPIPHVTKEIGVAIAKVAGVCTAIAIVDRVGRRPLLLTGSILMFVSYVVFGACFWLLDDDPTLSTKFEMLGIWNLYLFIYAWNLSWAPLMWVICAEILGDEFRSVGMGLTFAVFWLGSALSNQTLLSLFDAVGTANTFLLYAMLTACSLAFVFIKVRVSVSLKLAYGGSVATAIALSTRTFYDVLLSIVFHAGARDSRMATMAQWEEFECIRSMFPDPQELLIDAQIQGKYEAHVYADAPPPQQRLQYAIRYTRSFGKETPTLEISYPPEYPAHATVEFTIRCPFLSRHDMETLHAQLTAIATNAHGEVVVLQLYQQMLETLTQVHAAMEEEAALMVTAVDKDKAKSNADVSGSLDKVLGRRAIYFHHIINPNKRHVVMEWALELQLGGFSKIGWPGIVIVEGPEANVREYVRRLQHLRWKQIVVRGEQTEVCPEGETIDAMRRLPRGFQEFPETGMSALAAACRDAGVEELFLTTMKIYGRSR